MGAIMINDLRKEITRLKEEVQEKKRYQEYQRVCIGELKSLLHERDVIIPQKAISEYRDKLEESERMQDFFMGHEIECSFKLEEAEKELGYYRWYEIHIEQQRSDTFYDMRNGNEYRTRGGLRIQYRKEMELKEIEWRNKSNS
tara:strand:- start:59 stop:487 length:429 start_codon:yes stop_codon:yes gene_type:complete